MFKEYVHFAPATDARVTGSIELRLTPIQYWDLHKDELIKKLADKDGGYSSLTDEEKQAVIVGRSVEHRKEEIEADKEMKKRRRQLGGR